MRKTLADEIEYLIRVSKRPTEILPLLEEIEALNKGLIGLEHVAG